MLGIHYLYVRIERMSLRPVYLFSPNPSIPFKGYTYVWNTLYRLRQGCHCLSDQSSSLQLVDMTYCCASPTRRPSSPSAAWTYILELINANGLRI
jgi:hypothetical protein